MLSFWGTEHFKPRDTEEGHLGCAIVKSRFLSPVTRRFRDFKKADI